MPDQILSDLDFQIKINKMLEFDRTGLDTVGLVSAQLQKAIELQVYMAENQRKIGQRVADLGAETQTQLSAISSHTEAMAGSIQTMQGVLINYGKDIADLQHGAVRDTTFDNILKDLPCSGANGKPDGICKWQASLTIQNENKAKEDEKKRAWWREVKLEGWKAFFGIIAGLALFGGTVYAAVHFGVKP